MLSGETKMFPVGFFWLRVRRSSKAKAVFELLMAAMTDGVQISCNEQMAFEISIEFQNAKYVSDRF